MSEVTRMGFEGQIFYGVAGSTATSLLENSRDINTSSENERSETTIRGDSSGPPKKTESVTLLAFTLEFQMVNDSTDALLTALLEAEATGTAVAIRTVDYAAGKGFDGDCTLVKSDPKPLNGEQVITFTATPTRDGGRTWQPYV